PAFNQLVQKQLEMGWLNPTHILGVVVLTLACGLLAGSYPSLYLSSFDPVKVLKGLRIKSGSAAFVRQGLVVLQFGVSVVFIISTIVVYQQVQHVKNRNLGFNKDNLLEVDLQHDSRRDFPTLRQDLLRTGAVANAALAGHATLDGGDTDGDYRWVGKDPKQELDIAFRVVSSDYVQTSGMHIWAGHDFTGTAADTTSVLINRSFAKMIDSTGVVDDYHFGNMYGGGTQPLILYCNPSANVWQNLAYVRIKPGHNSQQTLAAIAAVIKKHDPDY